MGCFDYQPALYAERCQWACGVGAQNLASAWEVAGGDMNNVINAVAVAMAESCGGDPYAMSPTGAIGAWQIEYFHAQGAGEDWHVLFELPSNARYAVKLSSNGTNWAAWDVAYAAGEALTRLQYLPDLQPGSAAYNMRPQVIDALQGAITTQPYSPSVPIGGGLQITPTPVANAPTSFPAVGPQPDVAAPQPTVQYQYPNDPAPWSQGASGWDAIVRLYRNDLPYYTGHDQYLIELLDKLPGSEG